MVEITTLTGAELDGVRTLQHGGLYLLQSQGDLTRYRLGETKNHSKRKGNHGSSAPKSRWKKAPNWTEVYRPWKLLWAAVIPDATHLSLKMCEHHLHAVFARSFEFVDESGFEAPAGAGDQLIDIAQAELSVLVEINRLQRRPKFDKEAHYRAQWREQE